jgi:hypothetical protein
MLIYQQTKRWTIFRNYQYSNAPLHHVFAELHELHEHNFHKILAAADYFQLITCDFNDRMNVANRAYHT